MTTRLTIGLASVRPGITSRQCVDAARRARDLGFDVFELPDHLGMVAPLATLAGVAAAVPGIGVGNCVLNAAFYTPHLLVRDIAAVHQLSGGRFIATLGAGWNEAEFVTAGIAFPPAAERVRELGEMATAIRDVTRDPAFVAQTELPPPLIRLAGNGNRLLTMAARHADIVLIDPAVTESGLAERIEYVRARAGDRADRVEFAFSMIVALDDTADLEFLRHGAPDADVTGLASALTGSIDEAVERIRRIRRMGVDYITLSQTDNVRWRTLERLVAAIREQV